MLRITFSRLGNRILYALMLTAIVSILAALPTPAQRPSDLRTPPAGPAPHINGPKIYGGRPGHPFLFRIPCTGTRPMKFSAQKLPPTLTLNSKSGIISGSVPAAGRYELVLGASNSFGHTQRNFTIVAGDTIGLTPQMGWNDWYTFYARVKDEDVRSAARIMISSGMADYGYQFVNIDDAWSRSPDSHDPQVGGNARDKQGNILPNDRFPDMRALTDYVHSLGLKAGVYSSPGPQTCTGVEGSYNHEAQDARQFSRWGFDLLKYDWCSYMHMVPKETPAVLQKPYRLMGDLLKGLDRDVIFNVCEYGRAEVWTWAAEIGGNSWRTARDLGLTHGDALPGFYHSGLSNALRSEFAHPGAWNDPDYLVIGTVGDAFHPDVPAHPTSLSHEEQYTYMSMWSLMASPLIFAGDMTKLDAFTLNVLCNSEVIDIDQDPLGKQARIVRQTPQELILSKTLDDGSIAVGLFNLSDTQEKVSVTWGELGVSGPQTVRDVWWQRNIGSAQNSYSSMLKKHDVTLIRLTPQTNK